MSEDSSVRHEKEAAVVVPYWLEPDLFLAFSHEAGLVNEHGSSPVKHKCLIFLIFIPDNVQEICGSCRRLHLIAIADT
jgi:hypothetical protein